MRGYNFHFFQHDPYPISSHIETALKKEPRYIGSDIMSALRPSFFELLAVEQLNGSLRPALTFALEVLSPRHRFFDVLSFQVDEVYAILATALELASLRRDAATVSESFYTLRRSREFSPVSGALPPRAVFLSLFFAVFLPYVRRKVDAKYDLERGRSVAVSRSSSHTPQRNSGRPALTYQGRSGHRGLLGRLLRIFYLIFTRRNFLTLYPLVTTSSDLVSLIYKFAYLLDGTRYYTPALAFQRLILRRLTPVESSAMWGIQPPAQTFVQKVMRLTDNASTGLKYSLFAALVAYRFVEYYQAAADQQPTVRAPPPPPPQVLHPTPDFDLPQSVDDCPLCSNKRVNPSALAVSGYVFCYQCILDYVRVNEKCPVTKLPANRGDICRVYHEE